ncbi:unnamed protein product [Oppiella nova]|uniref:Uncharacterized protein n=1 Tax=Oppiella nova TaxID=334625 RepID=A0A7R9MDX9_9ACAR|nr:unnamed protein product [Oppiella nova]CAG2174389.1 unnamed protein product [Oppiella nova]
MVVAVVLLRRLSMDGCALRSDVFTDEVVVTQSVANDGSSDESTNNDNIPMDAEELHKQQQQKELNKNAAKNQLSKKSKNYKSKAKRKRSVIEEEIEVDENEDTDNPLYWSITDVHEYLKKSNCFMFAPTLREHEVDGAALLLLDYNTITSLLYSGYTRQYGIADASKLSALVESLRHKWARISKRLKN